MSSISPGAKYFFEDLLHSLGEKAIFAFERSYITPAIRKSMLDYFLLFKILKTFTKMLHTNLIGCRGKTKRDTKYNISTLKGEKMS